jgi:hypothetical protein
VTAAANIAARDDAATSCTNYLTYATLLWDNEPCPVACVEPDSPLCPTLSCSTVSTACPAGQTLVTPPAPPPIITLGVTTSDCIVHVTEKEGCAQCGCTGCLSCEGGPATTIFVTATAPPTVTATPSP